MTDEGAMLNEIAALGPLFAVETHDPASAVALPWRRLSDVIDHQDVLLDRVGVIRAYVASVAGLPLELVEPRVAVSVAHLGLTARLLSPVLALLTVFEVAVPTALDSVRWQPTAQGAFPLSVQLPAASATLLMQGGPRSQLATRWRVALVDGPLRDLVEAAAALSVSRRVLWGNVASAINGSVEAIAAGSPARAEAARELGAALLDQPSLKDSSVRMGNGTAPFRRRSCCLIYRASPRGEKSICGDCVLATR